MQYTWVRRVGESYYNLKGKGQKSFLPEVVYETSDWTSELFHIQPSGIHSVETDFNPNFAALMVGLRQKKTN